MNLEQNDFLTAYLDDELEPEQRLRVESALGTGPGLCEQLHDLAAMRDLVSELVEPGAPVDVSVSVVAAIRRRRAIGARAASWARRGAALVSAAAALIALASVGVGPANPGASPVSAVMHAVSARPRPAPVSVAVAPAPVVADAVRTAPAADGRRERERERSRVRSLLKSPNLRKVLIVTDVIGGDADRQVGDLIKKTPRRNAPYRRFTVSQGIAFDPEHPGEATVFAVVMDEQELGEFRASLDRSFPAAVQESDPRPELVTAMSAVGQVSVFPGTSVADVTVPAEGPGPALKAGATNLVQGPDAAGPDEDPAGAPARAVPKVASRERSGPRGKPQAPASSLVLVMVASPRPVAPRH